MIYWPQYETRIIQLQVSGTNKIQWILHRRFVLIANFCITFSIFEELSFKMVLVLLRMKWCTSFAEQIDHCIN